MILFPLRLCLPPDGEKEGGGGKIKREKHPDLKIEKREKSRRKKKHTKEEKKKDGTAFDRRSVTYRDGLSLLSLERI